MQGSGKLDLSKTAIIAISAVADENFRSNDLSRNFDIFCNGDSILINILYSGETC